MAAGGYGSCAIELGCGFAIFGSIDLMRNSRTRNTHTSKLTAGVRRTLRIARQDIRLTCHSMYRIRCLPVMAAHQSQTGAKELQILLTADDVVVWVMMPSLLTASQGLHITRRAPCEQDATETPRRSLIGHLSSVYCW